MHDPVIMLLIKLDINISSRGKVQRKFQYFLPHISSPYSLIRVLLLRIYLDFLSLRLVITSMDISQEKDNEQYNQKPIKIGIISFTDTDNDKFPGL